MRTLLTRRVMPLLALAALCAGCATNPVTGERQLSLISESQEIEMGRQAAAQAEQSIGLVPDQALQDYVHRIGVSLARGSERPGLPWTFRVVDDPTPNAFALPGGYIFVTRGLLGLMRSEAELASVLGHEIGHVTAKHSVSMISRAQIAQLGLGVGAILSPTIARLGDVTGAGMQLLFLKYGRDAERQADDLGFKYALADNYDVREMPKVFASLARVGEASGRSPLPGWLASHPYPEERIDRIQAALAQLQQSLDRTNQGVDTYMARINRLVYGENPRAGFFNGTLFLHPDLRFRWQLPQGWKTQNMSQAVLGGSPQEDALMQLTIVQGSASDAANRFFGQQGLTASRVQRETINGLSAATGYFQAQTEQGTLTGFAGFITLDANTYQILGYAPANRFPAYENAFRQSIGSFARLTDAQALNVQPNRLATVRITRAMTLAEFNRQYPSKIDLAELALINELADANARIPAGTWMKRVVAG
ncbi:MAG TPA: M48 family metalloprotease [Longimicrobiales bacterium]|nr:M48 family metalloprotease [Longimicrobiales bacterium]